MLTPDTIHNIVLVLCLALLAEFAWSIGAFVVGLLSTPGKIGALIVLLLLLVVTVFGKV